MARPTTKTWIESPARCNRGPRRQAVGRGLASWRSVPGCRHDVSLLGVAMRIGAVFPQLELAGDVAMIRDWAQAVESLGYADVLVTEHVVGFRDEPAQSVYGPVVPQTPMQEPLVLFGYLAAVPRVESVCRPGCWCCHSARPQWWPSKRRPPTCSAVDVCGSGSVPGTCRASLSAQFRLSQPWCAHRGTDRGSPCLVDRAGCQLPRALARTRRGWDQSDAGATADPDLDGRDERSCDAESGEGLRWLDVGTPRHARRQGTLS